MTRRNFTPSFKTKVVLEALKERKSLSELSQQYELHPNQISKWKQEFLQGAEQVFASGIKNHPSPVEQEKERLLKTIGQLKVENDFLKNALG